MNEPVVSIPEVIRRLEDKGVRLWVADDSLHYSAPPGSITHNEKAALRLARRAIVELIGSRQCSQTWRAPLSFTQEAHWNLYRLHERPSIRQIASAVRLRGSLNIEALEQSVREVVRRHASLRTNITVRNGVPEQEISSASEVTIKIDDYSHLCSSVRKRAVIHRLAEHVLEPVQLASDPLLSCLLIKEGELEHTFAVSMEHMISDAASMNIFIRDLFSAYDRATTDVHVASTYAPIQFPEFAAWLRATQLSRHKVHGAYWDSHLLERQYTPFPRDHDLPIESVPEWQTCPVIIGRSMRLDLQKWSQQHQTTLVLCILTAYFATLLRWCNTSSTVVQYLTNGRHTPAFNDTIGYFATPLFICIDASSVDRFSDLLRMITLEYCEAAENADYSYLESRVPRPAISRSCIFNWVPQGPNYDRNAWGHSNASIVHEPVNFGQPMLKRFGRDNDPGMTLFDTGEEITGGLYYPVCRFSRRTMNRFGKEFLAILEIVRKCRDPRIQDISP